MSHEHHEERGSQNPGGAVLTIRPHTGLSGDMLCCGLGALWLLRQNIGPADARGRELLNGLAARILPAPGGHVAIAGKEVGGICGWHLEVDLPQAHEHRTPADIAAILEAGSMEGAARELALECFARLAACEAAMHGREVSEIHFHEVGALDSILDIGLACALYAELGFPAIVCGPLPMADGQIDCAHGILPAPAPAVLALLPGLRVRPFAGAGELVTPTAAALLHALRASFGGWPSFLVEQTALVYGSRDFPNVPNGALFALGRP